MRGLDVIEAVESGAQTLGELSTRLALSRSTAHRLAAALVDRGYLAATARGGYRLGPKLLELGVRAGEQVDLIQIARPHLEALADDSGDTVHLAVVDDGMALYLDKQPGRRRITIASRVGERQPLSSTGLGKALLLDADETYWRNRVAAARTGGAPPIDEAVWLDRMRGYVAAGRAYDLEENEDQIRCVAAPVRDVTGAIVAAISVSSAAQYMSDGRMETLSAAVLDRARKIGAALGYTGSGRDDSTA